jgi:hypothetical protein
MSEPSVGMRERRGQKRMGAWHVTELSNVDVFVYALWRLGAVGHYIDTEDAFQEAYKLAPSRFSWRTS